LFAFFAGIINPINKITIVGGGAAGFFAAIHAAENHPKAEIVILEGSNKVLSKVLISGGGRCNVTNAIWKPTELIDYYPRGHKKLYKPFEQFNSMHTQKWFKARGVELKTEPDGRVFPVTDDSATIANLLQREAENLGIRVSKGHRVNAFEQHKKGWILQTNQGEWKTDVLIITSGSNPSIWKALSSLGLSIVDPVPSLFTFHCEHPLLRDLAGISLPNATTSLSFTQTPQSGPILITHEGLSGPAVLKLSAWAARELHEKAYKFNLNVNWLSLNHDEFVRPIRFEQENNPKRYVAKNPVHGIPKRLWKRACDLCDIPENRNYAEIGKKQINKLSELFLNCRIEVFGKSTNKEEFVTAGGVELNQIDLSNFSVKGFQNLYMAGEVLNIDAVTGGFNFQAAWTGGYLIGAKLS
jgi:predicted Rossmann fold flavoprotein